MDETGVYMERQHKQTSVKGENHIGVIGVGNEGLRFTMILTVRKSPKRTDYSVSKLPPIIIFKKYKSKKCQRERTGSDVFEDAEVRLAGERKGGMVLRAIQLRMMNI